MCMQWMAKAVMVPARAKPLVKGVVIPRAKPLEQGVLIPRAKPLVKGVVMHTATKADVPLPSDDPLTWEARLAALSATADFPLTPPTIAAPPPPTSEPPPFPPPLDLGEIQ